MQNLKNKKGQGLVEYVILICLIAVALFATVKSMSDTTQSKFEKADQQIQQL